MRKRIEVQKPRGGGHQACGLPNGAPGMRLDAQSGGVEAVIGAALVQRQSTASLRPDATPVYPVCDLPPTAPGLAPRPGLAYLEP